MFEPRRFLNYIIMLSALIYLSKEIADNFAFLFPNIKKGTAEKTAVLSRYFFALILDILNIFIEFKGDMRYNVYMQRDLTLCCLKVQAPLFLQ